MLELTTALAHAARLAHVARTHAGIGALALLTSACFFDSRWLQQQQSQQAALENAKPAELRAAPAADETEIPAAPTKRVLRVRAHASARYAAEVVDWPRQLAQTLDAAGVVLGPTLGVRLEIAKTAPWSLRGDEADLSGRLDELMALDDGNDIDWVIGLVGSVPRAELSYHQLGVGRTPGKHLVMRAMNDAREHEAIERAFARLGDDERRELYRSRKRHKTVTVLLHEMGHTLGLPHEVDPTSIMHARYEPKASGFSGAAAELMRLSLARRLDPAVQTREAFSAAFAAKMEAYPDIWVPAERDATLAQLRSVAAPSPGRRPRAEVPAAPQGDGLEALSIIDRNTWNRAVADKQAGRVREALAEAQPLFKAYPDVFAVQELRCQLAMVAGGTYAQIQAECERMTVLSTRPR